MERGMLRQRDGRTDVGKDGWKDGQTKKVGCKVAWHTN